MVRRDTKFLGAVHVTEQLVAGEDPAGLGGHQLQQRELARGALDRVAAKGHLVGGGGDGQVPDGDRGPRGLGGRRPAATQQGAASGHQLAWAVGLGEVVVGTHVETAQQVVLVGPRGEHQDRQRGRLRRRPQHPADVVAVERRHHHVEDEQVRDAAADGLQCRAAVGHDRHGVALRHGVPTDQLGLLGVVLRDQDPCHLGECASVSVSRSRTFRPGSRPRWPRCRRARRGRPGRSSRGCRR